MLNQPNPDGWKWGSSAGDKNGSSFGFSFPYFICRLSFDLIPFFLTKKKLSLKNANCFMEGRAEFELFEGKAMKWNFGFKRK